MKGTSRSIVFRILVTGIFSFAFILGAVIIFGLASLIGIVFGIASLPFSLRVSLAVFLLIGFAFVDLISIKNKRYCHIGLRRQTPKTLIHRYKITTVAAIWGLDTGLAITTFRVAAITWGALLMTGLELSSWWIGFGYGVGFTLPLSIQFLLFNPNSKFRKSLSSRLEELIAKRSFIQFGSATILFLAALVLSLKLLN